MNDMIARWLWLALLAMFVIIVARTLVQWHRDDEYDKFSLIDLVAQDGRLSSTKFFEAGAFAITSFLMILLALRGAMTEGYMVFFGGLWVASRASSRIQQVVEKRIEAMTAKLEEVAK